MDCFTFLQNRLFRSRSRRGRQRGPAQRGLQRAPTTRVIPLGVIRIPDQTRLLLVVLEYASGSWLASAQDSHHRSTGFVSSNYILA